jgi:hypothetical protein
MALEGTHLRFAFDLTNQYHVCDRSPYYFGAIYPDSRYLTNTKRECTHPDHFKEWDILSIDDFHKGWHAHLLCDNLQYKAMKELIPDIFQESSAHEELWIKRTAIKIIEDFQDITRFDIQSVLPCLDHIQNPNGETEEDLHKYSRAYQSLYADPQLNITRYFEDSHRIFGISKETVNHIREWTEHYQSDEIYINAIGNIYERTIEKAREWFSLNAHRNADQK